MRYCAEPAAPAAACLAACCRPLAWTPRAPARRARIAPRAQLGPRSGSASSVATAQAPQADERAAKAGGAGPRVVDVHCHFFSEDLKAAWRQGGGNLPGNIASWTPARLLEEMDRSGVAQSVLSLASAPLHWFHAPQDWRGLVRSVNEYGAQLVRDHKGRHAQFAFITCRDVEGSLREIEYAFDTLRVSGVEMATSFGDMWPGDPAFAPVFEELNRRRALVYFHPARAVLLRGARGRRPSLVDRISVRHHARDRQPARQRRVPEIPGHHLRLLPRRRRPADAGAAHRGAVAPFKGARRHRARRRCDERVRQAVLSKLRTRRRPPRSPRCAPSRARTG